MDVSAENPSSSRRFAALVLALLIFCAIALRLTGITGGLPGDIPQHYRSSYTPDERPVLEGLETIKPWRGAFRANIAAIGNAYLYAVGAFLLLAKFLGLVTVVSDITHYYSHPADFARVFLAGRIFSALCGAATVIVLYFAVRRAGRRFSPLAGAAFTAFAAVHILQCHLMKTHPFGVLVISFGMWAFAAYWQNGRLRNLFIAAAVTAVAGNVSLMYGLYGGLFFAGAIIRERESLKKDARNVKRVMVSAGGCALIFWIIFLIINPEPLLAPGDFLTRLGRLKLLMINEGTGSAVVASVITTYLWYFASPAAVFFIVVFFIRRRKSDFEVWLAVSFIAYLTVAFISQVSIPRYHLPVMPVLVFMVSSAFAALADAGKERGAIAAVFRFAGFAALGITAVFGTAVTAYFLREDPRTTASKAILKLNNPGATVATTEDRPYLFPPVIRMRGLSLKESDRVPEETAKTFMFTVPGKPEDAVSGKVSADYFIIISRERPEPGEIESRLAPVMEASGAKIESAGIWPEKPGFERCLMDGDWFFDIILYRIIRPGDGEDK
ncbi:MAG: hypothetical protein ACYS8W_09820 [Planctomycetota bacterium]|jgi:hypothetical protein